MPTRSSTESRTSKGGRVRASRLTPEERSEIARQGARARWGESPTTGGEGQDIPIAAYTGELRIGDLSVPCAVLDDGRRVLSERGMTKALGGKRGGSHWRRKQASPDGAHLPVYLSAGNLQDFIPSSLAIALRRPTLYRGPRGGRSAYGVEASLLPEICEVWLRARDAGVLVAGQEHIGTSADILMRGLAHVGIIALVDEATGYQAVREREELHHILEAYINQELLPWSKTFPDEYYHELFRLRGWKYSPPSVKRPRMVGKLTHDLVYEKLPPGVIDELKRRNPVNAQGYRRHKHFQLLTGDIGEPHLKEQVASVTTLMRAARSWPEFQRMFGRAFPTDGVQGELFASEEEEQEL